MCNVHSFETFNFYFYLPTIYLQCTSCHCFLPFIKSGYKFPHLSLFVLICTFTSTSTYSMFQLRYNVSSQRAPPSFEIEGLEPGASYRLNMFAVNGKGRSDPAAIETVVFKGQAKFVGEYTGLTDCYCFIRIGCKALEFRRFVCELI